jgi:hypothetical protein
MILRRVLVQRNEEQTMQLLQTKSLTNSHIQDPFYSKRRPLYGGRVFVQRLDLYSAAIREFK